MDSKARWRLFKKTIKIAVAILITIWQYHLSREKKELDQDNVHYQKEF